MNTIIPIPKQSITIRPATMQDVPAVDALQKRFNKALGFFPRAQMEGYIKNGWMLVAEASDEATKRRSDEGMEADASSPSSLRRSVAPSLLGYIASRDRYLKRDELGVIYQLCVA